jgi:two-component system, OmpR family, sensor kinase
MVRSIRWSLQAWHAVILVTALTCFGVALYAGTSRSRFKQVDTELDGAAQVIASHLRGPPPRLRPQPPPPFDEQGPPPGPPEGRRGFGPRGRRGPDHPGAPGFDSARGRPFDSAQGRPFEQGTPEDFDFDPQQGPPGYERRQGPRRDLQLPAHLMVRFGGADPDGGYFVVWSPEGNVLQSSLPTPAVPPPPALSEWQRPIRPGPPVLRQRGNFHEVLLTTPQGERVLVGRSINRELTELHQLAWLLVLSGAGVTAIGLAGGWLLSRQVVRPIHAMTTTARAISSSNLSQRIDVNGTRNELTELAGVLNATFDRLESAFAQQIRFTADASHELRTPLSIIHSQAELALSRERSAGEYRQTIEACLRAARRMKSLAEALLTLARADAGKLELKCESFDLRQTVEDCVQMIRPMADEKQVALTTDLQAAPVIADAFRLTQVITNLLSNAVHYNRPGGSVSVTVQSNDRGATFTVADTGVGIAEEDNRHLFDRFYRVDKARTRQAGGSGLGLAICKSIIDAHGGSITVHSTPGEGSTFTVHLRTSGIT